MCVCGNWDGNKIVGYQKMKRETLLLLLNELLCVLLFMWLYSNFQENVMTVMLTHGWPLCYVAGFESPRNRFWLNGIMSQTVPLWTGTKKKKKAFVPGFKNRVMCTLVSGGADNAASFFFSTVYRCCCCRWLAGWWCCCCTTTPTSSPSPPQPTVPWDRSTGIRE